MPDAPDQDAPRSGGTDPRLRGYVICSEPRSGSTLLCQWLGSTGMLGVPGEYFSKIGDSIAMERDPARLGAVLRRAATANGVYGIKLFSYHFDVTAEARWVGRLPGARFIHLERRDLLGQAISLVRALQTRQYHSYETRHAEPRYDGRAIRRELAALAQASGRWRAYFARNGLDVLWLVYEDMVRDPEATLRAVADHVGLAEPVAIRPDMVAVSVQRDAVSDAWRARFLAEAGDMDMLDHPLGRLRVAARRLAKDVGYLARRLTGRDVPVSAGPAPGGLIPRTDHSNTG